MIEEIGYYYAPFIDYFKDELRPIFEAGRTVKEEIEKAIKIFKDSTKNCTYAAKQNLKRWKQLRLSV
jgi:hypothetical protein